MNPQTLTSVDATLVQRVLTQALGSLVDEVRSSVDYYRASSTGGALSRLVLTGGGSRLPQIAERLAATMNVTVVPGTPFAGIDTSKAALTDEQLRFVEPMAAVPVGLAMGGLR